MNMKNMIMENKYKHSSEAAISPKNKGEAAMAVKIPLKHPNQKRLEEALEKLKEKKKLPKKKKEVTLPSSHRKIKKAS
jgi:Rad3-related DNA helicase